MRVEAWGPSAAENPPVAIAAWAVRSPPRNFATIQRRLAVGRAGCSPSTCATMGSSPHDPAKCPMPRHGRRSCSRASWTHHGVPQAALVGHSMGGKVAMAGGAAAARPGQHGWWWRTSRPWSIRVRGSMASWRRRCRRYAAGAGADGGRRRMHGVGVRGRAGGPAVRAVSLLQNLRLGAGAGLADRPAMRSRRTLTVARGTGQTPPGSGRPIDGAGPGVARRTVRTSCCRSTVRCHRRPVSRRPVHVA